MLIFDHTDLVQVSNIFSQIHSYILKIQLKAQMDLKGI